MAFTLALFGLYFTAINLQQGYPEIGYALQNSAFILLIAVPVLTMRVLSEEQKNKTDQLLLTAPVKISDIILGKYLALLTIYVIPVLIMCLYPLLLGTHGTVSYAVSYTSILGSFFIIIALVCLWIGSMIKNPIITGVIAVIGEGALTAVYFTKSTLLEGKIQDLLGVFNMAGHMDNFVNGILDIGGIVYYLSVIAICTFLAMQSLQKKRWN